MAATVCNTVAVLPVFLLGALAFAIRRDLDFGETHLGAAVSLFFAVSAAGSTTGGWISERLGATRAMFLVAIGSGTALLGIAALTTTYAHLLGWLAIAGMANALCQPATNLALLGSIPRHRQGLAIGVKQAAVPAATMLAGFAVPTVGLTVGWRWAFASAALVAVFYVVISPRHDTGNVRPRPDRVALRDGFAGLVLLALSAGVGLMGVSFLGAFYVESAVHFGVAEGAAGIWFGVGGLAGVLGRVGWGWFADRRDGRHFPAVALLLVFGALGVALLQYAAVPLLLALGTILAFGTGWSWMGVFHLGVVRQQPGTPAVATGVIQTGAFFGGVVGPLALGALVAHVSHAAAWSVGAGSMLLASALILLLGRRMTIRSRQPR